MLTYRRMIKGKRVVIDMRKIIVFSMLFHMVQIAHAATDWQGSMRPTLWRSSITCALQNTVSLATTSIHLHSITITSSTVNQESFVSFFNSTGPAIGGYNTNITTVAMANTNSTIFNPIPCGHEVFFDRELSSGSTVTKSHQGVCVDIKWDYSVPKSRNNSPVPYFP